MKTEYSAIGTHQVKTIQQKPLSDPAENIASRIVALMRVTTLIGVLYLWNRLSMCRFIGPRTLSSILGVPKRIRSRKVERLAVLVMQPHNHSSDKL